MITRKILLFWEAMKKSQIINSDEKSVDFVNNFSDVSITLIIF